MEEGKELLIKDLCARLPHKVIVYLKYDENISVTRELGIGSLHDIMVGNAEGKPYLRSMSTMTEEEVAEFESITEDLLEHGTSEEIWDTVIDWLNAHHFDHRHLIEKGLALEAPEGMYKTE